MAYRWNGFECDTIRGRVLALTPEMAAQLAIEQKREAEVKAAWAKADAEAQAQWNREYGNE